MLQESKCPDKSLPKCSHASATQEHATGPLVLVGCAVALLVCWWFILQLYGMALWPYMAALTVLLSLVAVVCVYLHRRAMKALLSEIDAVCREFAQHFNVKLDTGGSGRLFCFSFQHPRGGIAVMGLLIPVHGTSFLGGEWYMWDFENRLMRYKWQRTNLVSLTPVEVRRALEQTLRAVLAWERANWQHEHRMSDEELADREKREAEQQKYPVPRAGAGSLQNGH